MGYDIWLTGEIVIEPELKALHANILERKLLDWCGNLDRDTNTIDFDGDGPSDWDSDIILLVTWLYDNGYQATEGQIEWDGEQSGDMGILTIDKNVVSTSAAVMTYPTATAVYRPVPAAERPLCRICQTGMVDCWWIDNSVCSDWACQSAARKAEAASS